MPISVHTKDFFGPSGITFILLLIAAIFYTVGFGSNGWAKYGNLHVGLWASCTATDPSDADYFVATQVFITFGLIGLIAAICLMSVYMCASSVNLNFLLTSLTITCFGTVLFMLIGIIIFGAESPYGMDWSYAMAIIGMIFTLAAGCTATVQMYKSDVQCPVCQCRQ